MFQASRDPKASARSEILVDGEVCEVWISKDGKSWRVHGAFKGKQLVGKGPNESAARSNWTECANYEANR